MFKRLLIVVMLVVALAAPAIAQQRIIVRTEDGLDGAAVIRRACENVKCQVQATLDGNTKRLFVVTVDEDATTTTTTYSSGGLLGSLLRLVFQVLSPILNLLSQPGVEAAEHDQFLDLHADPDGGEVPPSLYDKTEVDFYGTKVRRGYLEQPAVRITALDDVRRAYNVTGSGVVVGIIDTGVDPKHAALINVLLPGYDFTRNVAAGSELSDVDQSTAAMVDRRGYTNQSTAAMVDEERPAYVNQSTAAMVDQSTAAMVDNPDFAAFGHGTMVAGVVHLVAPQAKILPLKAFGSDGTGYGSDVIRAIYYAANNGAHVLNMSFSFQSPSRELERACYYAARRGLVLVASTGNEGRRITMYPAGYSTVMGIASTDDRDYRSDFSNYGYSVVWVAAPGEAIVTTYPYDHYAATWGTSFSTPFVAGAAALLRDVKPLNAEQAKRALSNARWINFDMGKGRVDMFRAVQYWR
ncbi:MAG: S8 family peptidase, partial [Candidatus Acidiferrales bacterium]